MPRLLALLPRAARCAAAAAALLLAAVPGAAAAQTAGVNFAPVCTTAACNTLRFSFANPGATTLLFNTLTLTASTGSGVTFAPADPGSPTIATVNGSDAVDVFGGTATIGGGGRSLFIDFFNDLGFAFELAAGRPAFVDVDISAPARAFPANAFTFAATFTGGSASGPVTVAPAAVVPEPATVALVAGGLAVLGAAARRRRAA